MTQRVLCQHARVLHARSFRETSLLVDFFTQEHGRVCAVARGARTQRSKFRGLLQPFIPVTISWSGRSDLVTLSDAEPCGMPLSFSGTALLSGLYINELLVRLLARHDPHPELFMYY
ncbi:MAG: DNA repair protein RecO, partial [Coxiellaceae bacterium]|nr:DNA repair protein RecO [Coxiellaceae bacterium]